MIGEILHPLERPDADAGGVGRDAAQRQGGDVDESRRGALAVLDQRDQIGPARNVFRAGCDAERKRGGEIRRTHVAQGGHRVTLLRVTLVGRLGLFAHALIGAPP
jgi:hypothetical protein